MTSDESKSADRSAGAVSKTAIWVAAARAVEQRRQMAYRIAEAFVPAAKL